MLRVLIFLVSLGARAIRAMCRRRADLVIENLALRQQVTALKKELSIIIISPGLDLGPDRVWSKYSNAQRVSSFHLPKGPRW